MPTRVLRDWTDSEAVNALDAPAEVLFIRLIMKADDYGLFTANPRLIRSLCFPFKDGIRESDISRQLAACEKAGLIALYQVADKPFLRIVNFGQRLRAMKSRYPLPPDIRPATDSSPLSDDGQMTGICQADDGQMTARRESESESESESDTEARRETEGEVNPRASPKSTLANPSVDQVRDYCVERGNSVDPVRFVDFYESKGWMVGKNRMKDWRAAVRTWEKNESSSSTHGKADLFGTLKTYSSGRPTSD